MSKKIGIVGYGHLGFLEVIMIFLKILNLFNSIKGKYLIEKILNNERFELVFVWNRSEINDENLNKKFILKDLDEFYK